MGPMEMGARVGALARHPVPLHPVPSKETHPQEWGGKRPVPCFHGTWGLAGALQPIL
jgi:hypothetical protein